MKYSVNWLNELAGTTLTPKEMAELFTRHSFEVDALEEGGTLSDGIVVGKILEVSPHPNADKLSLTRVTIDPEEKQILSIVCGAKNIAPGDIVPVATIGTTLPEGIHIKESEIRGERSQGMLCAEDELGLGKDHSGILHLDARTLLGTPLSAVIPQRDAMIELDILSARGHDALSHVGIAREICAMKGTELVHPTKKHTDILKKDGVVIEEESLCHCYVGIHLAGLKNGPSPAWIQERLKICGVRPVNAIVDITNYVMLETGQPLHAFDAKNITHNTKDSKFEIYIRNARKGEKMILLDKSEIKLSEDDLVIANTVEVLALAGVMGGFSSGTSEDTTEVFLESASFDATSIRKTRVRHRMNTESSYRFERDIDPNMAKIGMMRAVELLEELCGAKAVAMTDIYPDPVRAWSIDLDLNYITRLLGIHVPKEASLSIFKSLGLTVSSVQSSKDALVTPQVNSSLITVSIPTFRRDLHTQEDLIEEVGRLYGYDKIAPVAPLGLLKSPPLNKKRSFERKLKDALVAVGCDEVLSYSFYRKETAKTFGFSEKDHFVLQNPMNPDQQLFQTHLLPNRLEKLKENLRYFDAVQIFEVGKVYKKGKVGEVQENRSIIVLEAGGDDAYAILKGRIEAMFTKLSIEGIQFFPAQEVPLYLHKTRTSEIVCRGKKIATLGEISPFIAKEMKIKKRTICFFADMDELFSVSSTTLQYQPIARYPAVWRDMSLIVPKEIMAAEVSQVIRHSIGKNLKEVELFDIYEKDGEKSFAYHLAFGDATKTLTKDEVEVMFQKCLTGLKRLKVTLKM